MESDRNQSEKKPVKSEDDFLVVGLGASAGGIQALKEFFINVTADSGIAYVVILHMSPEHESHLAEVLQATSPIPVTQVKQRVKVVPDHVYVIPPNQNLTMTDGHLTVTDMIGMEERRSPVDLFFRTLAETNDSRAVSVILSGTGSNGSMGLKRIKEHGGVALAQDLNEAQYTDMPRNAIATGLVDYVMPVAEMPAKILSYDQRRGGLELPGKDIPGTDEHALRDIFTRLRMRTGHDFSNYKRATMLRRIERRLGIKEFRGLPEYARYLSENQNEPLALMKDLLISVTNFFRDPESLEALAQRVLAGILAKKDEENHVRVWIAGCATGEEAYSIAMLLAEALQTTGMPPQIQLFATDLDADAVAVAREGYYNESEVADVSPERLRRFFSKDHQGYRVRRELRETILFAVHNLIKDPPFSHLDLISCRNLLIYLNRTAQNRVLELMHFALSPGGYLFLGTSESVEGSIDLFSVVDKEHHIFQRRAVPARGMFPLADVSFRSATAPIERMRTSQEVRALERMSYVDLHQRLLEELAPPSVVVNEEYDIVHLSDRAGQYMQIAGGEPTTNLLKLVRPELRLDLRTALYQAVQNHTQVHTRGLQLPTSEGTKTIDILIRPVLREADTDRGFILVVFRERSTKAVPQKPREVAPPSEPIARQLEDELMQAKSQLRATVEQYEIQQEELRASNEELQAMNEELRSAAEELETSKEELQSLNEELTTVNQELKIKIEELGQANNDFANLINSTDIGTIFLDRSLSVKQFTPRARDIFSLLPSDISRPLADITHKLRTDGLLADIESVVSTLHKVEREVQTTDQKWYMMRILPYRTMEDHIDGAVITFNDITASKIAERELERARQELETKVTERTGELQVANESLWSEVAERRHSEVVRMKLLKQLVSAQEAERARLARDLHDQLGQQLTALRFKLESLKTQPSKRNKTDIDQLLTITSQLDSDVDFLAWQLRPVALDDLGLVDALKVYVRHWSEHTNIDAGFHSTGFDGGRMSAEIENNLYRVAQEALNNVAKHSRASNVDVLLEQRGAHVALIIEDNGIGFTEENQLEDSTLGLNGIRERALLLGGEVEVETALDKGTTLFVKIPLISEEGNHSND